MIPNRREVLKRIAATTLGAGCLQLPGTANESRAAEAEPFPIVDTHQHLWDLSKVRPPWLESAKPVLRQTYATAEYLEATRGLNIAQAVYMEVDVAENQLETEARDVLALCRDAKTPTRSAVLGGRPASPGFSRYLDQFAKDPRCKGVRQVLHSSATPAGFCRSEAFVGGIRELGRRGLRFDLCMRPGELLDGLALAERCPETRFVIDHCGNADPTAFGSGKAQSGSGPGPSHDPDAWKRAIEKLAGRPNVVCKISGIVARAPRGWTPDDLAPVVNHCLDAFGPDRVVFGGDWPVCLLGSSYRGWVEALRAIVSNRPADHQRKLWHDNAVKFYDLAS